MNNTPFSIAGIPVEVVRSQRRLKSISIQVRPQAVIIRAPVRTPQSTLDKLLRDRQGWIVEHWNNLQQQHRSTSSMRPQTIQAMNTGKALASREIPRKVQAWADHLGLSYGAIRIKDQRSRWGSCSKAGNLNFNWRLMQAPGFVLDYVIVHELCHLRELNHSSRFWRLVEDAFPRYKEAKMWLRNNGSTLFEMFAGDDGASGLNPPVHDRIDDVSKT